MYLMTNVLYTRKFSSFSTFTLFHNNICLLSYFSTSFAVCDLEFSRLNYFYKREIFFDVTIVSFATLSSDDRSEEFSVDVLLRSQLSINLLNFGTSISSFDVKEKTILINWQKKLRNFFEKLKKSSVLWLDGTFREFHPLSNIERFSGIEEYFS